jgi:serine/threonine protein kinase
MADVPEKDLAKDGLLAIAPRDPSGRPTLGGIPLYKKLGQGGMGAVYLGKHPRLGVEVAVKILPFHLADQDPNAIEYFMREANVAARLNHPNLVRIFDVNVDGDPKAGSAIWYLVMEFVAGRTAGGLIRDRVKTGKGPLPEGEALDLLLAVTEGLAAAHEEGFVHRDIKPENIIIPLSTDGEPALRKAKLMDLGLAKVHSEELSLGLTGTNVAMGTPGYMAPEQAENAKSAGPPADVFAMGATLYTLLSGAAPFTGTTVLNVLKKTSDEAHVPIRKVNPGVSRPTEICVDTCLAKRPEARYPNAGVLREALKACRQSAGGEVSTDISLASLQNLVSLASSEATVKVPTDSVAPSRVPRTLATAKPPEPPPAVVSGPAAPAARPARSKAGLVAVVAAVLLLLVGGALAVRFLFPGGGGSSAEAYDEAMREGRAAEALFEWPKAEAAYEKAQGAKDTAEARAALERVRKSKATDADFTNAMKDADAAFAEERYADAERLYEKAHQKKPASTRAEEGETRSRKLKEQESTVGTILQDATALADAKDFDGAWQKIQSGIQRFPEAFGLRFASAKLALDHGIYPWLGMALNDAEQAIRFAGPLRKKGATEARDQLIEKKKLADARGGALQKIQAAIDRGDFEEAEGLLGQADEADRTSFTRAIAQGRKWKSAMERGRKAEQEKRWPDALLAYREAQTLRSGHEVDDAVRRSEQAVREEFGRQCSDAEAAARAGKFDDARKHAAEAEKLLPADPRNAAVKEEIDFREHLAEARRLKKEGKATEALAAARKALDLRRDDAEAKSLVAELRLGGPLEGVKSALAAGDRAKAAQLAREAAAVSPKAPELRDLQRELWADLFVEKAKAPGPGPVEELMLTSDGRIVGVGAGYASFGVWATDDLKGLVAAPAGGPRPFHPALVEKDGLKIAGLGSSPGADGPDAVGVMVWEGGRPRAITVDVSGMKLPLTATRLATFDGALVLRLLLTAGVDRPDTWSIDFLDMDKGAPTGNSISNQAEAHASVALSPKGDLFATGGGTYRTWKAGARRPEVEERKGDPQVYLWRRDNLEKRSVKLGEPAGEGTLLAFTSDGAKLLVATAAKRLFIIDTAGARVEKTVPLEEVPTSLAAGSDGWALVLNRRVFLIAPGEDRVREATGFAPARSVLYSRDGASLLCGGDDRILRRYAFEPLVK